MALVPDPNGLLDLPHGFQYRAFSRTGEMMSDGAPCARRSRWDGGFPGPQNTVILVRNHELSPILQHKLWAKSLRFSLQRGDNHTTGWTQSSAVKHYASLSWTDPNCAGGPLPGVLGLLARRIPRLWRLIDRAIRTNISKFTATTLKFRLGNSSCESRTFSCDGTV